MIRYVYAALRFKAKVPLKAQCQCSSVSTKEHRNVTLGFVTIPRSLSRRTRGRLPAPATSARMMIWQIRAPGSPLTTDQARNRSHVTGLIRHRLRSQWCWNVVEGRRLGGRRHLSSTAHQHRACLGTLAAARHQVRRALFGCTQMQPAREHIPMLAYRDHTHTGRARDYGRIKHALAVIKELLGCHKQPLDRCTLAANVAL